MRAITLFALMISAMVTATVPASAITFRDIAGRWCSDEGNYNFGRTRMQTLQFGSGVRRNIKVYDYFFWENSFRVIWVDERKYPITTHYAEFSGNRMIQLPTIRSGRRELRRCKWS